ncbi:Rrf2 family transcriptional regulator [Paenibacillus sp. MBLB4367]|uniref:Rrf2 family transcriptional regulator n=1 Tax=Paenibacillus sp. MBLB4367 TaxID=3384767 RepID=UPI0039083AC8
MMNSRLAVAIHILSLLASNPRDVATSEWIAGSVNTNPVVIRRITGMLKQAGLLRTQVGVPGAELTRAPSDISLLEVYRAVQPKDELFAIHEQPNPACPVGKNIQSALDNVFDDARKAMEDQLAATSVQDILSRLFS